MPPRRYSLGKRQASVDATRGAILAATRELLARRPAAELRLTDVAREADVSRLTVYNQFGSRAGLLRAFAETALADDGGAPAADVRDELARRLAGACARWAAAPSVHRNLGPDRLVTETDADRNLAERLAAADQLRPGCSIREAEDVIGALTSFALFDRLHHDGRRSPAGVAEILSRLASSILAERL